MSNQRRVANAPVNVSGALHECHARLRLVPQQRLHWLGEGAYRVFVRSFFIFITELVGGPQGTTERCRVRADIMADEAVILEHCCPVR
jgi:hypothetical protein